MAWHTLSPAQQADYEKKSLPGSSQNQYVRSPREAARALGQRRRSAPRLLGSGLRRPRPRLPGAAAHPIPGSTATSSRPRIAYSPRAPRLPQAAARTVAGRSGAATGSKPATPGAEAPNPSQISTQILGESFFPPFSSQFFPKSLTLTFLYMYYAFWLL